MAQRPRRNVTLSDEVWHRLREMSHAQGYESASRMIEWLVNTEWQRRAAQDPADRYAPSPRRWTAERPWSEPGRS